MSVTGNNKKKAYSYELKCLVVDLVELSLLSVEKVVAMCKEEFGISIHEATVYRWLKSPDRLHRLPGRPPLTSSNRLTSKLDQFRQERKSSPSLTDYKDCFIKCAEEEHVEAGGTKQEFRQRVRYNPIHSTTLWRHRKRARLSLVSARKLPHAEINIVALHAMQSQKC